MLESDYSKLEPGMKIWHKEKEKIIEVKRQIKPHNFIINQICFKGDSTAYDWADNFYDCSLEAPMGKKKYYKWIVEDHYGCMYSQDTLLDDDGKATNSEDSFYSNWIDRKKKRIDDIFWEE